MRAFCSFISNGKAGTPCLKDGIWQPGSSIRSYQGVPNSQTHGKQLPKYFVIYVYFLSTFDAVTRRSPDGKKLVNVVSE